MLNGLKFVTFMLFVDGVIALMDEPPRLECLSDAMRMHFVPGSLPFSGHVYVKGFFFSQNCHLDYTRHLLTDPFYLHVPYNSTCQVHREKVNNPAGQSFSIVLIIQHHPLFVTQSDKAFSVSCLYRDHPNELGQKLEIGDITTQRIQEEPPNPDCTYEVLAGGIQGQVVKFASIGDILVHRWTCETGTLLKEQGILVHSCFVRDGLGNEFPLLNERGCVTDGSLMSQQLTYTEKLNTCYTPINAFKFADQMIVYFSCQITLCKKAEDGCEGITPPVCELLPVDNTTIPVITPRVPTSTTPSGDEEETATSVTGEGQQNDSTTQSTTTRRRPTSTVQPNPGSTEASRSNELPLLFKSSPWASSRHARQAERHKRNNSQNDLLTIDVQADRLIIFTKDENPALTSMRLSNEEKMCHKNSGGMAVLSAAAVLIWFQNRYFTERIQRLQTTIPSPFELGYMSTTTLSSKNSTPHSNRRNTIAPFSNDPFAR
ncbi:Zona pellucida domain-containing protein [Aphelenchoides bicaudatus]|nr:Zona pellucida domain-containing protein [Aphelenchoides bicaudatus]